MQDQIPFLVWYRDYTPMIIIVKQVGVVVETDPKCTNYGTFIREYGLSAAHRVPGDTHLKRWYEHFRWA